MGTRDRLHSGRENCVRSGPRTEGKTVGRQVYWPCVVRPAMPVFFVVSNESHFARVYDLVGRDTPLQRLVMPVRSFVGSTRAAMLCFQAARQVRCAVKLLAAVMRGGKNAVIVS